GLDLAHKGRVIGVEPFALKKKQLLRVDQTPVKGNEGQRLESHHLARATSDLLRRRDQHEILESDAVMTFEIEARLVRQDHAWLELNGAEPAQPLRPPLHPEVATNTVTGAVIEVEPCLPKRSPGEGIEGLPACALGES